MSVKCCSILYISDMCETTLNKKRSNITSMDYNLCTKRKTQSVHLKTILAQIFECLFLKGEA